MNFTKSVIPRVSEFHDPALCLETFFDQLFLFSARPDMRNKTIRNGRLAFSDVSCPGKDFLQEKALLNVSGQAKSFFPAALPVPCNHSDLRRLRRLTTGCHARLQADVFCFHFFPLSVGLGPTAFCAIGALL